jgi:peptidoglycan/LPS O-acetylase OafA/YrhL
VPRKTSYIPTLDGWRAVAICLVLCAHGSDSIRTAFARLGQDLSIPHGLGLFGVQLFFGLSGFLITTKIIEDERRNGVFSLKSFYLRRAFRILPAAIGFLLLVALLSGLGVIDVSVGRWLSTLLFFANYSTAHGSWYVGHFWSLAVEEHFYFVWPFVFLVLGSDRRRLMFVIAGIVSVAIWRAIDFKYRVTMSDPALFWGRTDINVDGILCGVAVALLYADRSWNRVLGRLLGNRASPFVLFGLIVALEFHHVSDWKLAFLVITVKAMLVPLAILSTVIHGSGLAGRFLETAPLRFLGRLSYSLYLYQQLFLPWDGSRAPGLTTLQSFPVNVVLALTCAFISLKCIEQPLIDVGHRLAKKVSAAAHA